MPPLRWLSALLLALALLVGAALLLQRQAAVQLRDEIGLLRDENRKLATLRTENARLVAAQAPATEVERLRVDHAAVVQLRTEIEKLKARVEEREKVLKLEPVADVTPDEPEAAPSQHLLLASKWKNAGRATPLAALETLLWACANGDVGEMTKTLLFDDATMKQAQAMFDALPETGRKEYGNPFGLMAALMRKDMPVGDVGVTEVKSTDPDPVTVQLDAELRDPDGRSSVARFEFQKVEDDSGKSFWGWSIPGKTIDHFGAVLQGGPAAK